MKPVFCWILTLTTTCTLYSSAQESNSPSSLQLEAPAGLTLTDERTNLERIQFLLQVADAYVAGEDWDAAVDAYERVIELDPSHQQATYILSHVYISAKQYAKAEKALLLLVEKYPDDFRSWNNAAWLYATAEDPAYRNGKKAIEFAREALVLAPNDHHVWSTLSEAYFVNGQYEKAYTAIMHMVNIATRGKVAVTQESVDQYNEQIRKCKMALDTYNLLNENKEKEPSEQSPE
jgi:tetratricopeptide (TPR) repeat protein